MADLANPIVDIISRLWTCCATQTRYLCKLQQNNDLLKSAMEELKEARDDVQRKVVEAEADPSEPKMRTDQVRGWLQRVEKIEGEVEVILQKADEQQLSSRGRCLGGCCPPNNCCSNYKLGKSIAKKILPLVVELKGKGKFEEVTYRLPPPPVQGLTFVARPRDYLSKLQDNKILLRNAMEELKNVRNDVQRKVVEAEADPSEPKMRTDQVRGWLQRVEIIESEVEVILQKADGLLSNAENHEKDKLVVMKECHEKDKLVVMKMASVGELKRNGHFEEVTYRLPPPLVQPMNLESTVGMESMFDKVWSLIYSTNDTQPVSNIIGLYGQGGVGKTTLLEKINNELRIKISTGEQHGFGYVVIFVVVSQPVNYEAIQNKIGERLGLSLQGDESKRAEQIFIALTNKNYVLLLDDMWEDQSGDQFFDKKRIGIPIHPRGNSKLIFTTRSERVCGLMDATYTFHVECLPPEKALELFLKKVGEKALNSFSGARELAEVVAKECGGLPLALITIGRAMSTKKYVQEWRDAIITLRRYASEFKDMRDRVLPSLKLSYDNLSNEIEKSCFCYCALFPEDYSIEIAQLVHLWIAEGFINGFNKLDEARNRGHTIIGSLKSACLLESKGKKHVKMHDVIRDLALWIVNDCKSSCNTTAKFLDASNVCERWRNVERIFWTIDGGDPVIWEDPPSSPNLLTLLVRPSNNLNFSVSQSFFQFTPSLRVLDMQQISFLELPTSICELSNLQYLNLSGTTIKQLPIELRKLVKLKFLDLSFTKELKKFPPGVIANLSELQCLNLVHSGFKNWGLKEEEEDGDGGLSLGELDKLKQLQEVTLTISTSFALEEFLCNQKLPRICTKLELKSCVSLKSISLLPPSSSTTTSKGGLGNLISLKELRINSCVGLEELILYINDEGGETNTTTTTSAAAAAGLPISNNNKLNLLSLVNLPRLNNIVWVQKYHHYMAAAQQQHYLHYASHFQNLYSIYIYNCDALKDLIWVVYVEKLKSLTVGSCNGIETIIELGDDDGLEEEEASGGYRVFRKLEILNIVGLPNLKSICSHALVFPSIQTIMVSRCPKLKKLALGSGSNVNNTLRKIIGEEEWWNELQWEDKTIRSKFHPYLNRKI